MYTLRLVSIWMRVCILLNIQNIKDSLDRVHTWVSLLRTMSGTQGKINLTILPFHKFHLLY